MNETPNIRLHLTEDENESFINWRKEMNGTDDSNMQKIDRAIGEKADRSSELYATLLASAWTGDSAPFTQELSLETLSSERNGSISLAHSATLEQRNAARNAMLALAGQTDGVLTVVADGDVPEIDLPVMIILYG